MENSMMENIAMTLIANSGEARSLAFTALEYAHDKDFEAAHLSLTKARDSELKAHQAQTQLLVYEAEGNAVDISILLIHAQDHLMTSMLARELISEMVMLYETKEDKK